MADRRYKETESEGVECVSSRRRNMRVSDPARARDSRRKGPFGSFQQQIDSEVTAMSVKKALARSSPRPKLSARKLKSANSFEGNSRGG